MSDTTIRVLVVDDQKTIRTVVIDAIGDHDDLEVVGEAACADDAVRLVEELRPHVVILDLTMPEKDGGEALEEILAVAPATRVLILTDHDDLAHLTPVLRKGASGYVVKSAPRARLIDAIRDVFAGKKYVKVNLSKDIDKG